MSSGGARASSGPAPDPMALRRDRDRDGWRELPSIGRVGDVPAWPLTRSSAREADLWAREWSRPQAIVWEENGQQTEVALYVRSLAAAEKPSAPVNARTLVKQQQEALGLSLPGMSRLHWRIVGHGASPLAATGTDGPTAKDRWKVLDGGS